MEVSDFDFHTCKGSLAIAEETIEAVCGDEGAAVAVLIFAACLAAHIGKVPPSVLNREIEIGIRAARTLLANTPTKKGLLS